MVDARLIMPAGAAASLPGVEQIIQSEGRGQLDRRDQFPHPGNSSRYSVQYAVI